MQTTIILGVAMSIGMTIGPKAHAAELKVLAGGSLSVVMAELAPKFESATGHKLAIRFAGTPELIRLATSGEPFDLGVVPSEVMKDASARAKFGPTIDIARVGYGIAVKTGAPKPDISTPDAFKSTLLNASSVTLYPESAAGAYVIKTFDRLGIGEAMKPKVKAQGSAAQIASAVAHGDAELGVFLVNVLTAPGLELVGPFPGALQQEFVFTGAVASESNNAEAASAFITYLRTSEAAAIIKAGGMTPG